MRHSMKPLLLTVLLGTALLPLTPWKQVGTPTPAAERQSSLFEARAAETEGGTCGFTGHYGLTLQGKIPVGGDVTGVGVAAIDGHGKISGSATGTASSGMTLLAQSPISGTYHLNDDCTGTFSLTFDNVHFTLSGVGVLVHEGRELHTIITSPAGFQLTGTGSKQ
jgi:hypothetical protein